MPKLNPLIIPLAHYPANVDQEASLYIHFPIEKLVDHALTGMDLKEENENFFHLLYANLIFNYLGKWCLDAEGNIVQIDVLLLETVIQKNSNSYVPCPIYADEVLAAKFSYLLEQERAFSRTFGFQDKNLNFNLNQIANPETNRLVRDLLVEGSQNRWQKWHPKTGLWYQRTRKQTERNANKPGTLHTKKQPGTLLPTRVDAMNLFMNSGIALLFDFTEIYHEQEKYCFPKNAATNNQWWYQGQGCFFEKVRSVGSDKIRANNRRAVSSNEKIEWNEIRGGLPKKCLRGVLALSDNPENRFDALLAMYYATDDFHLDYDLPVLVRDPNQPNGVRYYSHEQRLQDLLQLHTTGYFKDYNSMCNNNFIKKIIITSCERLGNNIEGLFVEKLENLSERMNLDLTGYLFNKISVPVSRVKLTVRPCTIKFSGHQTVEYKVTSDKILSGLALVTILPLAGIGLYKMIDDVLQLDEEQWVKVAKGIGISLATVTVLPVLVYGAYHAASIIATPTNRANPSFQSIEGDKPVVFSCCKFSSS